MWRVGEKRPSRHSSYSMVGDQLSPSEPPRKRIKVAASEERRYERWNWEIRGRLQSAWNSFVGGIHRLLHWRRGRATSLEDSATMDDIHTQTKVPSQQKDVPHPLLTSTPSQRPSPLTPTISELSIDMCTTSQVGPSSTVDHNNHISSRSECPSQQTNNAPHPVTNLDERPSPVEKQVTHRASRGGLGLEEYRPWREKHLPDAGQPSRKVREPDVGQPSREARGHITGRVLRERHHFDSDQLLREKSELDVGRQLKEEKQFKPSSEECNLNLSLPRTSANHLSGSVSMRSKNMLHCTTSVKQSTGESISLFTPMLSPEVIGPSLCLSPSNRPTRKEGDGLLSSFCTTANAYKGTATEEESPRSPVTLSPVSQLPWKPLHPVKPLSNASRLGGFDKTEPMMERRRASASRLGDRECHEFMVEHQHLLQSSQTRVQSAHHTRVQDTQEMRQMLILLERIKTEHAHGVEDRKIMGELIEKKIQLHQNERMALEDARVSRLRQQLTKTSMTDQEVEKDGKRARVETLAPLSDIQVSKVRVAVGGGPASECLSQKFNIRITRSDIGTLMGLQWLNDEVINFYFNLIKERSLEKDSERRVHVFNTFFYSKLSKAGYSGVRRWTKKVDVFEYDLVLVPVHMGMHWCLAAVDFCDKCVSYYDSLHGSNNTCLQRLRDYLVDESKDKKGVDFDLTSWTTSTPKDIPHQMNGSDCGVFTCMYARFLSVGSPFQFSQDDMPAIRQHMIAEILEQTLF